MRVDLRFPDVPAATDAAVISRFINALKARIDAYQKRKHREGKRVHPTTLHYVWAREFGECKGKKHYHLMLLVFPGCTGSNGRSCDIPLHQCPESPNRRLPET
ncbi:YagK/YfjJ domain-containing protein [Escherichia coli]|uniref:YagK/YfjJ domain-containing protein n=1 Tax=Escherichia coli TaxID=562 RepID=UPI003DA19B48